LAQNKIFRISTQNHSIKVSHGEDNFFLKIWVYGSYAYSKQYQMREEILRLTQQYMNQQIKDSSDDSYHKSII